MSQKTPFKSPFKSQGKTQSESRSEPRSEPMFNIPEKAPLWLMGLLVVIHLLVSYAPKDLIYPLANQGVLLPLDTPGQTPLKALIGLCGHSLLHSGWGHVLMNGCMIVIFGVVTIRGARLMGASKGRPHNGVWVFLIVFVASVVVGGLAQWGWWAITGAGTGAIGASGGASGLFATTAWAIGGKDRLVKFGIGWAVINVVLVLAEPILGMGIAWAAHIGGYIGGMIMAPFFVRARSTHLSLMG